jgi:hypothetical protein
MLEQQQTKLVSGLKEMYHFLQNASAWKGPSLDESYGHPLTHNILSALDLIKLHHDSGKVEIFEENCDKLRSNMIILEDPILAYRKGYASLESENSHHERPGTALSHRDTPVQPRLSLFTRSSDLHRVLSLPLTESSSSRSKAPLRQRFAQSSVQNSPLEQSSNFINDPQLYAPEWKQALAVMSETYQAYRDEYSDVDTFNSTWEPAQVPFDLYHHFYSYQEPMAGSNAFRMPDVSDLVHLDKMESDSSEFVWQPEAMT